MRCLLFALFWLSITQVDCLAKLLVGVNIVNPDRLPFDKQLEILNDLAKYKVKLIRVPLTTVGSSRFIRLAYDRGISTIAIVYPMARKGATIYPVNPAFPQVFAGVALSETDPEILKNWFSEALFELDKSKVVLAGVEVGNEINWSAFNREFQVPGSGRVLGYDDLHSDQEGIKIARGYIVYLKSLAAVKAVRDVSVVNKTTPIISAGLSDPGLPGRRPGQSLDAVSIPATLRFLKEYGIDKLVDGYGVHHYPSSSLDVSDNAREVNLKNSAFSFCGNSNKPCWLTEWGLPGNQVSCPLDDRRRSDVARRMMSIFDSYAEQKSIRAAIYYSWTGEPYSVNDRYNIFVCGHLSETGGVVLRTNP